MSANPMWWSSEYTITSLAPDEGATGYRSDPATAGSGGWWTSEGNRFSNTTPSTAGSGISVGGPPVWWGTAGTARRRAGTSGPAAARRTSATRRSRGHIGARLLGHLLGPGVG